MNHNSTAGLSDPKAVSKVDQAIFDIDHLTDELSNVAGKLERDLSPVLTSAPPRAGETTASANLDSETELLTKLHAQRRRLELVLSRYCELTSRVSI